MLSRSDPRIRRALDNLSQTLETANDRTQENIYTFTETFVTPILRSLTDCIVASTSLCTSCCPGSAEGFKRWPTVQSRGRAEFAFDFYDDWDEEENDPLLEFAGNTETLFASRQVALDQTMDYSIGSRFHHRRPGDHRASMVISSPGYFGFLSRIPSRFRKPVSCNPSLADLGSTRSSRSNVHDTVREQGPLDQDEGLIEHTPSLRRHKRSRSATEASCHTTASMSSRGDIIPSEDEMDDAVPLDDEFASNLEPHINGHGHNLANHVHAELEDELQAPGRAP